MCPSVIRKVFLQSASIVLFIYLFIRPAFRIILLVRPDHYTPRKGAHTNHIDSNRLDYTTTVRRIDGLAQQLDDMIYTLFLSSFSLWANLFIQYVSTSRNVEMSRSNDPGIYY